MVRLLRSQISRYALIGVAIAVATVLCATLLAAKVEFGELSLASILGVQRGNPVLWLIDTMPFVYAFWGQYATTNISYEVSSVVVDETDALRLRLTSLEHRALHDALTDLPNRLLLYDRIRSSIEVAKRENWRVAVTFMDLDQFKQINDQKGHQVGDAVLQRFAQLVTETIRGADTVGRWGGDEFVVVSMLSGESNDPAEMLTRLAHRLDEPLNVAGHFVQICNTAGVAMFPNHGKTPEHLLENADLAMYHAKRTHQRFAFYEATMSLPGLYSGG
jgi:diguanylate cyclase (GGDEF)-like protein